jgi:hypothetical protein
VNIPGRKGSLLFSSLLFSSLLFAKSKKFQAFTSKLIRIGAILVITLTSCEMNELDTDLQTGDPDGTTDGTTSRSIRPIILGNKKNNPFSLENMRNSLDTLKTIVAQGNQQAIKAQSLDGIEIEATDLYVRFLPNDTIQLMRLFTDTTLILCDFPLDYEIEQDGDYYRDPTVTNGFTWYYSVVKPNFEPPSGIQYQLIEELFIPENSEYYSNESNEPAAKSIKSNHQGSPILNHSALTGLYIVSFTLTGNHDELQLEGAGEPSTIDLVKAIGSIPANSPQHFRSFTLFCNHKLVASLKHYRMKNIFFLIISLSYFSILSAQDTHMLKSSDSLGVAMLPKTFGLAAGVAYVNEANRTYLVTAGIDYFFNSKINIDLTYSVFLENYRNNTYTLGLKYWWRSPSRKIRLFPFVGLSYVNLEYNYLDKIVDESRIWRKEYFSLIEVPFGVRYITRYGLQTSLQLSYLFKYDSSNFYIGPNVDLRVGWRFNLRNRKQGIAK